MDKEEIEQKLFLLDQSQAACTHCGLCSEACATYQATGWEHESPRGRIRLSRDFLQGKIQPNSTALETFDRCLGCRACEISCPLSVQYQQIHHAVQDLRRAFQTAPKMPLLRRRYRIWINLAYRIGNRWWRAYGMPLLALFYPFLKTGKPSFKKSRKQSGPRRQLFLAFCCVQDCFNHDFLRQTLTLLERLGVEPVLDSKQPCCGAIFERLIEGGMETIQWAEERQRAMRYQKRCIRDFKRWWKPSTLFLSKGCQCFMQPFLQEETEDFYAWLKRELNERKARFVFSRPRVVYYQPYCCQSKKDSEDPIWELLKQIEGLTVRWVPSPLSCCGGCKGEALFNPEQAHRLAKQKLQEIPAGAALIVTSPDCWAHFCSFIDSKPIEILYPIQLLCQAECILE
ncbi:(Fe-S)-binding protein [Candidatus Protochlamydia phocaeensis]|uniref:(Fe-S)-binding protein n=1 Tax=Candidatus Protochlamydia phocaeensis TaxID=1414722 RepID=UPI000839A392|nr:(Fe-S)-binding protein [Candidatus Protochlamydia phocaeensis]